MVAAVNATAGMVLMYNGSPISAFFSTSNGGYTTQSAWSDNPGIAWLVAKADPWSLEAPVPPWTIDPGYPWSYTFSPAALASELGVNVGTITSVEVIARDTDDPTSHARTVRITGTTTSTTMTARTFKSKLGLKSTLILSITGGQETFPGATRYDDTHDYLDYTRRLGAVRQDLRLERQLRPVGRRGRRGQHLLHRHPPGLDRHEGHHHRHRRRVPRR